MAVRRNSLFSSTGSATRSEYEDSTLKHNSMADNKLSKELAEIERAQKVISRDMAFERKSLENNIRANNQRRESMPAISQGHRHHHHHHHDHRMALRGQGQGHHEVKVTDPKKHLTLPPPTSGRPKSAKLKDRKREPLKTSEENGSK